MDDVRCWELPDNDKEIRQKSIYVALVSAIKAELIDMNRYSDWIKIKRVAGWIVRFTQNLLKDKGKRTSEKDLQVEELRTAEHILIKKRPANLFCK